MRRSLGLPAGVFSLEAPVSMVSDEIEQNRRAGRGEQTIADLVRETAGETVTAEDVARSSAPPEERHRHGG